MFAHLKRSIQMHDVLLYGTASAAEHIEHPMLAALLKLWDARRGARPGPARPDFEIADFRPWFGHLMILEPIASKDFRYRLYGATLANIFGFDLTQRTVRDSEHMIGDRSLAEYRDVLRYRAPVYVSRQSPSSRKHVALDKLALPLMEGTEVKQILAAIYVASPV